MLRLKYGIIALLTVILGCSDIPTGDSVSKRIVLAYGESAEFGMEGFKITFADIISDLRCPLDAVCDWDGIAEIELLVSGRNFGPISVIVAIGPESGPQKNSEPPICIQSHKIALIRLDPYPEANGPAQHDNYSATINVNHNYFDYDNPLYDPVHFSSDPPSELKLDPFDLSGAEINGDILTLSMSYSGGCKPHDFKLFMSPPVFLESYPVQANLYLRHDSHNDPCEAYIREEIGFDISRIKALYYDFYGGYDDIILNTYHYFQDMPGEKISVIYSIE